MGDGHVCSRPHSTGRREVHTRCDTARHVVERCIHRCIHVTYAYNHRSQSKEREGGKDRERQRETERERERERGREGERLREREGERERESGAREMGGWVDGWMA